MAIIVPAQPLSIQKPNEFPTEQEKFADGGKWFLEYAQWIVLNYYNTYSANYSYTNPIAASSTATLSPIRNTQGSFVDEILQNYTYFFGNQDNRLFNFMTKGMGGTDLPNIMLKGQEIRSLADHMRGKSLQIIQAIEKNISCESISENSVLKKQDIFDKIDLAAKIGDMLNEVGISFNPAGKADYSNPAAVKELKKKIRSEYENTSTVIARNAYYTTSLEEKYFNVVSDTIIGNLAGIEFKEQNGKLIANYIPGYQGIYDFSTWGEYGEGQTKAGYIIPSTVEELLHEYPNMNPAWRQEMEDVLYKGVSGANDFMGYYNQPFNNVLMWYNSQKWISKCVVYWITECNLPYLSEKNAYGVNKVTKLDPFKDYFIKNNNRDEKGNYKDKKKGYEIETGNRVYRVHKAVFAGAKYLLEYGYDTYQVRPYGDKSKPVIPLFFFCQGKLAGYVKSIVSRLRTKQDEVDAVRYRIREYTANDLGANIFINGAKLTETLSALDIVQDLRSTHISVIPSTGDAELDKRGMDDLVKQFSNNAIAAIRDYIILKNDLIEEMNRIVNITDVALGEQSGTIGKGVQQETISRSELSGLSFYSSLQEYFRRVLQYAANKNKMILMDNEDKNVIIPISNKEMKMLKMTKEMLFEDLNVYIDPNDPIMVADMGLFRQMLQAYAQQPNIDHAEALVHALKMMKSKSFGEGISMFEEYIDKKKVEQQQERLREATQEHQSAAYQNLSDQQDAIQQEMLKLKSKLAEINLKGSWDLKKAEVAQKHDTESKLSDVYIEQITELIKKQMEVMTPQPTQQTKPELINGG